MLSNYIRISVVLLAMLLSAASFAAVPDSVTVSASERYKSHSLFKDVIMGANYRQEWLTPVKMSVLDISTAKGGLKVIRLGGGMQTKSLRMEDVNGKKWVLRSVDKNIERLLPNLARNTPTQILMQDMISASHPYGALVVAGLSQQLGIAAPNPELFFVPDDPAFGEYRQVFANSVCFLEEVSPTPNNKSDDMDEVLEDLTKECTRKVLQKEVLKVRLLDMIIGDWDRHEGQWRWGKKDSAGTVYYYPIPKDRDQAFFQGEGVFIGVAKLFTPFFSGFTENPRSVIGLNSKAYDFDRYFLNELSVEEWAGEIQNVTQTLNDEMIDAAVKRLPPEIYAVNGSRICNILKKRRDALPKHGMRYYEYLVKKAEAPDDLNKKMLTSLKKQQ